MRYIELLENRLSPAFWAWFDNSKVVDANGDPLILYHGTGADIRSFRGMVWGSVSPKLANEYAGLRGEYFDGDPNVIPIYMRIENPFDADALPRTVTVRSFFEGVVSQSGETMRDDIRKLMEIVRAASHREESGPHFDRHEFWNNTTSYFGTDGAAAIRQLFSMLRYDGIRIQEQAALTFGAFSPSQAKSIFSRAFQTDSDSLSD